MIERVRYATSIEKTLIKYPFLRRFIKWWKLGSRFSTSLINNYMGEGFLKDKTPIQFKTFNLILEKAVEKGDLYSCKCGRPGKLRGWNKGPKAGYHCEPCWDNLLICIKEKGIEVGN